MKCNNTVLLVFEPGTSQLLVLHMLTTKQPRESKPFDRTSFVKWLSKTNQKVWKYKLNNTAFRGGGSNN